MKFTTDNLPYPPGFVPSAPSSGFDPVDLLAKRKRQSTGESEQYDPKDLAELEEFCRTHGLFGFNYGLMPPKAALSLLKKQYGYADDVIADLENAGYKVVGKEYPKERTLLQG